MDETSLEDRYIVVLSAWQRDLAELDFRAIRADGSIVEFSLPNPDLKSPADVTFATAPLTHHGSDYSLVLAEVTRNFDYQPSAHPLCQFDLKLAPVGSRLDPAESAAVEGRIGDSGEWEYLVFPEDDANATSVPQILRGFRKARPGKMAFEQLNRWRGPPAAFMPGARLRIGIHRKLPVDDVKFEVELPGK